MYSIIFGACVLFIGSFFLGLVIMGVFDKKNDIWDEEVKNTKIETDDEQWARIKQKLMMIAQEQNGQEWPDDSDF